jgi:NADH-quinone oxidoreductase subunit N
MTGSDFLYLTPLLIISGAPIVIMLTITFIRNFKVIFGFSIFAFLLAFLSVFYVMPYTPHEIAPLFVFDSYSLLFLGIIYFACLLVTILSYIYLKDHDAEREEFFIILFVAALAASILAAADHFVSFFLGIETLSVSLYILIGYLRSRDYSIEASVKYLILASVSAAFLLFGMALIYAGTGTMNFKGIGSALTAAGSLSPVILAGIGMIIVGFGFKLAVVPFHMWTPDVYQGAPAPVTAFIASVSKGAVMAVILRFFIDIRGFQDNTLVIIISAIAILSMFIGNLLALRQWNVKRLLAYSSIAHMGYLLITLLIGTDSGVQAAIFYIVAYIITTLGAFGVLSIMSSREHDADDILDYKGLFWRRPWIAIVFTLALLSLAGIPLTAGFIAKFYLVLAGIKSSLWLLAFSLIINSVIGLYYYLRVITTMFSSPEKDTLPAVPFLGNLVLAIVAVVILFLGIVPAWLTDIIENFSGLR